MVADFQIQPVRFRPCQCPTHNLQEMTMNDRDKWLEDGGTLVNPNSLAYLLQERPYVGYIDLDRLKPVKITKIMAKNNAAIFAMVKSLKSLHRR